MSSIADPVKPEALLPTLASSDANKQALDDNLPETVIERKTGWQLVDLRELWRHRELLYHLTRRDISVRYKQTMLGTAWAVVQPLTTMLVFAFFLGRMGGVSGEVKDYPLFVFAGVLPWTFFANAVTLAGNSVVSNQNLVSKVYFPRLTIPLSAVGACLFDFVIALAMLAVLVAWYRVVPDARLLLAPLIMVLLTATALGVGTLLAALIVVQRDFRYVLSFAVQVWMFATPCIYLPPTAVGPTARLLLPLNPTYGLLLNFRQAVLGGELDAYALCVSSLVGLAALLVGLFYFRRVERSFADVI